MKLIVLALSLAAPALGQSLVISNFGTTPDAITHNWSVSHDGGVVTGFGWLSRFYSRTQGFVNVPGNYFFYGASGDGSTLVGLNNAGQSAAVWAATLQPRATHQSSRLASSANADGSRVVVFNPRAVWDTDSGQTMSLLPASTTWFGAAITPDGRFVVGEDGSLPGHAAMWDALTGAPRPLGPYQGAPVWARSISADASVVAGFVPTIPAASLRWAEETGWQSLGQIPGLPAAGDAGAFGVSADGSRIVGYSQGRAFLWTASEGMRDLNLVLAGIGVDLQGHILTQALAISGDGNTIAGTTLAPDSTTRVFVATVPGPASVAVPFVCLLASVRRRRTVRCCAVCSGR
ncbi:hypothetical protein PHYC_02828 [Phycisphaerales bacterium]|nr:hypothetical protein PHYC_02828 [Phycisphaerales bacterium]